MLKALIFSVVLCVGSICSACGHGGFSTQSFYQPQVFVQSYPFVPLTFQSVPVQVQANPVFFTNSFVDPGFVNVNVNGRGRVQVNNRANVNVNAAGANVRVRSGLFGTRVNVR